MILCLVGVWMPLAALDGSSLVNDKSTSLRLESRTVCVNSVCLCRIIWRLAYDLDTLLAFGRYHLQWFWARNQLSLRHGVTFGGTLPTLPTRLCRPPRNLLMCRWRFRWWSSRLRGITTDPLAAAGYPRGNQMWQWKIR